MPAFTDARGFTLLFALFSFSTLAVAASPCSTSLMFVTPVARLATGQSDLLFNAVVVTLGKGNETPPVVSRGDENPAPGSQALPDLRIGAISKLSSAVPDSGGSAWTAWNVPLTISKIVPNTLFRFGLQFSSPGLISREPFWVTNLAEEAGSTTIVGPSGTIMASGKEGVPISISTGRTEVMDLRSFGGILYDSNKKQQLSTGDVRLVPKVLTCLHESGIDFPFPIQIAPNTNAAVNVFLQDQGDLTGTFVGNVILGGTNQKATSVSLSILRSSWSSKMWGAVCILAGVLTSLLGLQGLQNRISYDQVLLLIARECERAQILLSGLGHNPFSIQLPALSVRLNGLINDLGSISILRSVGLPTPRSAFFRGIDQSSMDKLKAFVSQKAGEIDTMDYIENRGTAIVAAQFSANDPNFGKSLSALNVISSTAMNVQQAQAEIMQQFRALLPVQASHMTVIDDNGREIPVLSLGADRLSAAILPMAPVSLRQVSIALDRHSIALSIAIAGVTFFAGISVLVLNDPAFGGLLDLCKCLLWGFGIQGIGQNLSSISPSTVRQSFTTYAR